ncbi:Superfamily I DNA or RNA helicase [Nocardioides scoriae]|uniref:DNA 3'-5' helicase n=1 Tax=Nocardioides scoriae TaxID=642780 RepID=A0A1H1XG23_9ACTN|nr:ATP-dependent DNA helicase [Nocardioides scoriae]SDT08197.1 Superfamily I DNA or RNA helicase [Nocardioides scoriae]
MRAEPDAPRYRLARTEHVAVGRPPLDAAQQSVVDHPGGPLLVLAGPGTGKTTTLVEAIVERVETGGASPDQVLALTFSRKAAEQLRDRVTARLGRTTSTTTCATFHSFAYGLIRRYAPADLYLGPLRLLSAPEQDVVLRELLVDTPESVRWPEALRRAAQTRGFAHEVAAVLGRAREKGLDGEQLSELGRRHDAPELVAAGHFLDQYLTILDDLGATDYSDLIRRATLEAQVHREELRRELRHVFVDEYQDTDPGQVALLRALAGDGRDLTVVGDPHQSIYGFRGADVRGILDFPHAFPRADGRPADVVALGTTRRFGPRVLAATQRVAHRLPLPGGLPEQAREAFLRPVAAAGSTGRVEVATFDTERAEAEHLADLLRRAHLEDGVAWHDMAVLVRSGRGSIPGLRRSLGAAGVPVEVAGDDVPLVRDPSVRPLLDALRAVLHLDDEDPDDVGFLDPGRVEALLTGPLGGLDAGDVRRLSRALRAREKEAVEVGEADAPRPRTSRELLREAVLRPGFLAGLPEGPEVLRARALQQLLHRARGQLDDGATAEELLWTLWSGTTWPARLRRSVEAGGGAARRAHRDLDSVVALFAAAARAEEQRDHHGVETFVATLVAQQLPADTLAEQGVRGSAVRLLTAHRSKGLEWRLVVVAHVQAEGWPDLRRRTTLLQADRIGVDELVPPLSSRELLVEERRLFYVACTRARERLVVTAVASPEDDGEQPSRFLEELGLEPRRVVGRPPRPLSMAGLVGELRRTVTDPETPPALRDAAASRLARLAREQGHGRPTVPQADPATWWGTRAATRSEQPVRDPQQPVPVSASVLESMAQCPTQWFLQREAGGTDRVHQSANLGQLLHALADRVATGELPGDPEAVEELMAHVEAVWDRLEFRTPWSRAREHARVRAALGRFLRWHRDNPRRLLGTETHFATEVVLDDGERVRISGYADRVEVDADGQVVVVDLKTGRTVPSGVAVQKHRQLGLYQYAVDHGAVDPVLADAGLALPGRSGGAELVQLGRLDDSTDAVVQQQQVQPEGGRERDQLRGELARAAAFLRAESFPATPGPHCQDCSFVAVCPARSAGSVVQQ